MPTNTIRFEELQLLELAAKARAHGCKKAYLQKCDQKLKKLSQRWCCLYRNFLFYFEGESSPKPLGVVFLEGTNCRPVEQLGLPVANLEGGFCVSSEWSSNRIHFFVARDDKERDGWIEALNNSNMSKLLRDLEEQRDLCVELRGTLSINKSEVDHLTKANLQAQENIQHLRGALQSASPAHTRKRPSLGVVSASPEKTSSNRDEQARVLQSYIRGWLIRRRWKRVVRDYLDSPQSAVLKKRNQLIWKFVASEEDYVSQLQLLAEEYLPQCDIASGSRKPPLSKEQVTDIFRNCEELLLFHQLYLRGLHSKIEKWPVVVLGDVLKLFVPMMDIYHQFIGNHSHALDVLLALTTKPAFKSFLETIQGRPGPAGVSLDSLLVTPLKRITSYIQDLQELKAHTPTEHVDYVTITETITELEFIQKTVTDEVTQSENIRQVLKIENMIEGGCVQLLDKEQILIRQGLLQALRADDKPTNSITSLTALTRGRLRTQPRHCFLFSKHLLVTMRVTKKPQDCYRIIKVFPLRQCKVSECTSSEVVEVHYRGMRIEFPGDMEAESLTLIASTINEKAQWMTDYSQCIENEKQNKIIQSQSAGVPVELDSPFIRYSTFKTGKEQLVNCGSVESLLERLVKVNYYGLDFLNTFLMTLDLYTNAHTVLEYLNKNYEEILHERERRRSGTISPQDAISSIRATSGSLTSADITPHVAALTNGGNLSPRMNHTYPRTNGISIPLSPNKKRSASATAVEITPRTITGIFFALKHWISKHFHHFREDSKLATKLELLIEHACKARTLSLKETEAVSDVSRLYVMQKGPVEEPSQVFQLMNMQSTIHLPKKPFECLLLWSPRDCAEQLCIIEATLFSRIENSEILRYFQAKGDQKAKVAPNLHTIFEHFNRMSLFFMWSVAKQRYLVDRAKTIEFLIQASAECKQLNNFSTLLQLMSALEHGSVQRYKTAWELIPKNLRQEFRSLKRLSSTDGRFKELRGSTRRARPPMVPYLGIVLNEIAGLVEVQPTVIEDNLVNFSKMRRCTRLVSDTLQYQKDPYEFTFISEISKVLLCTEIPGNDDDLYQVAKAIDDKDAISINMQL